MPVRSDLFTVRCRRSRLGRGSRGDWTEEWARAERARAEATGQRSGRGRTGQEPRRLDKRSGRGTTRGRNACATQLTSVGSAATKNVFRPSHSAQLATRLRCSARAAENTAQCRPHPEFCLSSEHRLNSEWRPIPQRHRYPQCHQYPQRHRYPQRHQYPQCHR